jgi:hypothetical protein
VPRVLLALTLIACTGEKAGPEDTGEPPPPLAEPYLAFFASALPGTFRNDCEVYVDLLDNTTGEILSTIEGNPVGGEWYGAPLPVGTLYRAKLTWDSCTNAPEGQGTHDATAFSGAEGDVFLFRYNGVMAAFETIVQRTEFAGGSVDVELVAGTTAEEVADLGDGVGASVELVEGDTWRFSWEDATNVVEVLHTLSVDDRYVRGGPTWTFTPDWW